MLNLDKSKFFEERCLVRLEWERYNLAEKEKTDKRADEEREYLANLQKGTEVYTKSGIIGTITAMTDKVVTLEVESGTKLKVLRSQVGGGLNDLFAKANKDKAAASKA